MKKKALAWGAVGFPIGMAIGLVITLIISACIGDGRFYFVPPALAADWGSEFRGAVAQTVGCGLYGMISCGSGVIWQMERWSLLKITVVHFVCLTVPTIALAYLLHWMPHHWLGVVGYLAMFVAIYIGIWCGIYFPLKRKIKKISRKLTENNQ